jgi:hypothetical protein
VFIAAGFVVNITLRVFVPRLIASTSCVCGNWHGSGRLCAAAGRGERTTSTRDCDHSRDRGAEIGKVELVASELADPAVARALPVSLGRATASNAAAPGGSVVPLAVVHHPVAGSTCPHGTSCIVHTHAGRAPHAPAAADGAPQRGAGSWYARWRPMATSV